MLNLENESLKVLKKCRTLMRVAGRTLTELQSPQLNQVSQKRQGGITNAKEEVIVKRLEAEQELNQIIDCLRFMRSDCREILIKKFMSIEPNTNIAISIELGMDEGMFYRYQRKALQQFGEAYFGVCEY